MGYEIRDRSDGMFEVVIARPVMVGIFGPEFAGVGVPMRILTPFIFVMSVSRVFTGILDYRGRAWVRAGYLALSVLLNFALNLVLIPKFGAAGTATGSPPCRPTNTSAKTAATSPPCAP